MASAEFYPIYNEVLDYIFDKYVSLEVTASDIQDTLSRESVYIQTPSDSLLVFSWIGYTDRFPTLKLTVSKELVKHIVKPIENVENAVNLTLSVDDRNVSLKVNIDEEFVWFYWHFNMLKNAGHDPKKLLISLIDKIIFEDAGNDPEEVVLNLVDEPVLQNAGNDSEELLISLIAKITLEDAGNEPGEVVLNQVDEPVLQNAGNEPGEVLLDLVNENSSV